MPSTHVAIVSGFAARALLEGRKRVETRFYRCKRLPYNKISSGDVIHFKRSGGAIIGTSCATSVRQFQDLTPQHIDRLKTSYSRLVAAPTTYWLAKRHCRYGILIWLDGFRSVTPDVPVPRQYGNSWLTLAEG